MSAGKLDLSIEQGTTYTKTFVWKPSVTASPYNLTGYTARMQVRSSVHSTTVLSERTTEDGGIFIDGPNGAITVGWTAVETAAFDWTEGVYDLELVSPSGAVTRVLKGSIIIDPEVTR